jgi:hypothetical protein
MRQIALPQGLSVSGSLAKVPVFADWRDIANLAYWVTGTEGSNPSLSATQSVLFTDNLEMAANPRVTRHFCAQCEPEKAISLLFSRIPLVFSPREEKTVRFTVGADRSSIA